MRIADDQLHAVQAPPDEAAEEFCPEGFGLGGAGCHAQHLAPPVGVDAYRECDRHADDAPALANLQIGGIDPEIGPVAFDGAFEEGIHTFIYLFAQPADIAF